MEGVEGIATDFQLWTNAKQHAVSKTIVTMYVLVIVMSLQALMYVPFNLSLVTAEDPFQDTSITNLLASVKILFMEDVGGMETDLAISVVVKKLVFHQVSMQ